jgi:uncharacterized membrane protein YcgQ (UPF0703/DUF1980 family)
LKLPAYEGTIAVNSNVKSLISIVYCLLLLFANVVTALAACDQISSSAANGHQTAPPEHHHADADHEHSNEAKIHCLIIEPFIPTTLSAQRLDHRSRRFVSSIPAELASLSGDGEFHRFVHDPPSIPRAGGVPSYFFISILRI